MKKHVTSTASSTDSLLAGQRRGVRLFGGVPGYNYLIQASTNLLDWQTVQQVQVGHVGDVVDYLEPASNTLPSRFYRLNVAP